MGQAVLATHGVPAAEDIRVRLPGFARLFVQLLLYPRQGVTFDAAEPRGLVLYAEQERVLVFDG